jgi:hypothetical protein
MPYTPTYSYSGGANPVPDFPRLLVADTGPTFVFSDQEISAMISIVQGQFQSGMFFDAAGGPPGGGTLGAYLPSQPIPYYRVAGMLLSSLAANKARLSSVVKLLDVTLSADKAAKALMDQAKAYFDADDNSGAFMIIEQVNDSFSFRDRYWKSFLRQGAAA